MKQKNPPARIKASLITDAKRALKLLAKTPPEDFPLKEAVYQLIPEILDARSSHRNDAAISEMLRSIGIPISASTLGSYVREYQRSQKATKAPRPTEDATLLSQEAQIGEPDEEPHTSGGIVFVPIEDDPDETDEEFAERVAARKARELAEVLLAHDDQAVVQRVSESD